MIGSPNIRKRYKISDHIYEHFVFTLGHLTNRIMKTRISTGIFVIIFFCLLGMYSIANNFKERPTTPSIPASAPATKEQKLVPSKSLPKPENVSAPDTLRSDSIIHHPEQSIKKLDVNMYRRSMYLHRKPFVV